MAFVVTRLCRDCKDFGCLEVCPCDCILEHAPPAGASHLPNQLYIDPDECIDCGACVPECPWEAIYPDADVPRELEPDVALNALILKRRQEFSLPKVHAAPSPSSEDVQHNKQRWGVP